MLDCQGPMTQPGQWPDIKGEGQSLPASFLSIKLKLNKEVLINITKSVIGWQREVCLMAFSLWVYEIETKNNSESELL